MIRELNTLMAVAREGTFAAAGERIGLTQAAVSAQMQRLETSLGFALFDRTGRTAQLNPMGRQVLAQAQELIRLYNNLGATPAAQPASELVNLGAIASVQSALLPEALARFHRQRPQCRTRVLPGVSRELVDLVDAGDIDLAAVIRPPYALQSDLVWTTLAREPYRLIAPRDMPGDDWRALLMEHPFIRYDRSSFGGRQVDRFLRQWHFTPREVCELDELEAIVKLVATGLGVALVPATATLARCLGTVRTLDLGEHTFHRDVGLLYRNGPGQSEAARLLVELVVGLAHNSGLAPKARRSGPAPRP